MNFKPPPVHEEEKTAKSSITTVPSTQHPTQTRPNIAFVSGHMDLTPQQFSQHYLPRLDNALHQNHHFLIGDAKGVDASALAYLLSQKDRYPDIQQRITVHVSRPGQVAAFQAMGVRTECEYERYDKENPRARHLNRDARMTRASDYDILWARTEDEERELYGERWRPRVSATEMNRLRRLEVGGWR